MAVLSASRPAIVNLGVLACVLTAAVLAHHEAVVAMVRLWNNSPMYSYGYSVPLIRAYLLWARRADFAGLRPQPSWFAGCATLLSAVTMTFAARVAGIQVLEQLAFLVSLAGAAFVLFGSAYVRKGWMALAYLLLMVPLWDGFTEQLHEPFQRGSASIAVWLVHLAGVPATQDGNFIHLPDLVIEVARACSGVNYLVAVVALGLPLGYLYLQDFWRRAILLVSAVAVAGLSNGLRVALITVLAFYDVGSPLHGPGHVLHGLFVAGIGYAALFAGLHLLSRRPVAVAPERQTSALGAVPISRPAAVALVVLFLLTGPGVLARSAEPLSGDAAAPSLPGSTGEWTAETDAVSVPSLIDHATWSGADLELRRRYRRQDGVVVEAYVAHFTAQQHKKELVTHRSTVLHNRATAAPALDANYVPPDASGVQMLFWYQLGESRETTRVGVKTRTLWNAVARGRTDGTVIVLASDAGDHAAGAAALRELGRVLQQTWHGMPATTAGPGK